jgi:hypothetical protein
MKNRKGFFFEFRGHRAKIGTGPITGLHGLSHVGRGLPGKDRCPAHVAHKPARLARAQRPLGVWSTCGSARASLDSRWCAHSAPPWHDRP